MALTTYTQTDSVATSGTNVGCSGAAIASTSQARLISDGGTAGSGELTISLAANSTTAAIMFEGEPALSNWDSGLWTVRLNVTTGAKDVTWEEVHLCHKRGSTFTSIGSDNTFSINLSGTPGVVSHTLMSSAVSSPVAGDTIYIVLVLKNSNAHSSRSVGFTPSEDIDLEDGFRATENDIVRETEDALNIRVPENFGEVVDGIRITEADVIRELENGTDTRVTENFV